MRAVPELALSHRQLAGMLAGGRVSSGGAQVSPTPSAGAGSCVAVGGPRYVYKRGGCPGTGRAPCTPKPRSGTGPARTSLSASPVLGQRAQPLVLKRGPPRLAPSRPWGHCPMLCPSAQAVGSGSPRLLDLPPPSVLVPRATPRCLGLGWSPRKLLLLHPCPAGSPQPSPAVLRSGLGRTRPPWAGSRGCEEGAIPRPRGDPPPLPLPSPRRVPPATSPRHGHGRRHAS